MSIKALFGIQDKFIDEKCYLVEQREGADRTPSSKAKSVGCERGSSNLTVPGI